MLKLFLIISVLLSIFSTTASANNDTIPVIYSGYCSIELSPPFAEFNKFCLNGTDFNTAQNYFTIDSSGDITIIVPGYYSFSIFAHTLIAGMETVNLVVNGAIVEKRTGGRTAELFIILPLDIGDNLYFTFNGPDRERAGDMPYYPRNNEYHNRMIIYYLGPIT